MDNKKLDSKQINSLISSVVEDKKYDLALACDVQDLVNNLKNRITEDFQAIDAFKPKLDKVSKANKIVQDLDFIKENLSVVEKKVNELYEYVSPKA